MSIYCFIMIMQTLRYIGNGWSVTFLMSSFLYQKLLIQWDYNNIEFYMHSDCHLLIPISHPTRVYTYIQHDLQLEALHEKIFDTIHHWCSKKEHKNEGITFWHWKTGVVQGMTRHSKWKNIQTHLQVHTYNDYYHLITQSYVMYNSICSSLMTHILDTVHTIQLRMNPQLNWSLLHPSLVIYLVIYKHVQLKFINQAIYCSFNDRHW